MWNILTMENHHILIVGEFSTLPTLIFPFDRNVKVKELDVGSRDSLYRDSRSLRETKYKMSSSLNLGLADS
jgi:hypothetical protein